MIIPCPLPVSGPRSRRQATFNQTFPQQRTVALTDKSKRASWSQVGARASDRARSVSDVDVSEQLHLGCWQASERSIKASCYFNSMWAILRYLTTAWSSPSAVASLPYALAAQQSSHATPRSTAVLQRVESGNAAMQLSAPIDCPSIHSQCACPRRRTASLVAVAVSFASPFRLRIHLVPAPLRYLLRTDLRECWAGAGEFCCQQ